MSTLETLIGRPLHEVTNEELEEIITQGRLAREASIKPLKVKKEKKSAQLDLDLGDDDFSGFE